MLCGEFLRRNHHILAYDIAEIGYPLNKVDIIPYIELDEDCDPQIINIVALIAFSHGIGLWEAVDYLEEKYHRDQVRSCNGIKTPFLMALLRISDFFDISSERANKNFFNTNKILSPISNKEWLRHKSIEHIEMDSSEDPELIFIGLNCPPNSEIFLSIKTILKSIQYEIDVSWAVIGRYYGRTNDQLKLSFRRIGSNLKEVLNSINCNYVAEKINLDINRDTLDLLVEPLYQYKPTFGVRELIQNAVDACNEKKQRWEKEKNEEYMPKIEITIKQEKGLREFCIRDNGIGMDYKVIKNYFLVVGATYRKSKEWKESYIIEGKSKVPRNGRFGVGVLAAFLLGNTISVITKKYKDKESYHFEFDTRKTQIEVIKESAQCDEESGTEIRIPIDKSILEYLKNQYKSFGLIANDEINWIAWYYGRQPELKINVPKSWGRIKYQYHLDLTDKPTGNNWRAFKSSNFEKIEYRFGVDDYNILFYNGIIIPDYYLENNCTLWPLNKPAISVIDNNAELTFDLQRTEVIRIPFAKDLYEDIYLDILLKFMSCKPILNFYQHKPYFQLDRIELAHPAFASDMHSNNKINKHFIFHKDGYAITHRFFLKKQFIKRICIIRINNLSIQFPKSILDEYIIFVNKNKALDDFASTGFSLIPSIVIKRVVTESRRPRINDQWEYIICDPDFEINEDIKKIADIMPEGVQEFGFYRYEIEDRQNDYIELDYFKKLLDHFIGNSPLIPYSLHQRKIRYSEIYKIIQNTPKYNKIYFDSIENDDLDEDLDEDYNWDELERCDGWDPDFFYS